MRVVSIRATARATVGTRGCSSARPAAMGRGRKRRGRRSAPAVILLGFAALLWPAAASSADPIADLIACADSLARAGDERGFAGLVRDRGMLIGAAVGRLLDAAIEAGEAGDGDSERETAALAGRLAAVRAERAGAGTPLELVLAQNKWTGEQRALRARARAIEAEAVAARDAGELDLAATKFREALELYRLIDDRRSIAVAWGSLGVVHWSRGDWEAVRDCYTRALEARRGIEDRMLEGKSLNGLGSVHFQMGDFDTAVAFYRRAAALRREIGDAGGLVQTLNYLGATLDRMGRLGEAAETLEEALGEIGAADDPLRRVEFLNTLGSTLFKMGRLKGAESAAREAVDLCEAVGETNFEASCRINLADLLNATGRYREGIAELDRVSRSLERVTDTTIPYSLYRTRGLLYLGMGELEQARNDLVRSLELAEASGAAGCRIQAFINLASLFMELQAVEEGLEYAQRASDLAAESQDLPLLRDALLVTAALNEQRGRYEDALALYRRAADLDEELGNRWDAVSDRISICNSLAALGRRVEARNGFRDVQPAAAELETRSFDGVIHFGIGHTYETVDRDSAAWHYERALECLEKERASIGGSELRSGFLSGDKRRLYEEVGIYYAAEARASGDAAWADRAFRTIERGKARGLLDLLGARVAADCPPAEEALLDSIYRLDPGAPGYRERKLLAENRYAEMRDRRMETSLGGLRPAAEVSSIADVRAQLTAGTVVFSYALGDTASLLWVIDSNGCDLHRLPGRSAIDLEVMRFRDAMARPGKRDDVLVSASRNLYRTLVEPGAARLEGAKSIVFAPDGSLFELPFEALLTGEPAEGAGWRGMPFLAGAFTTLYVPSGTIFCSLRSAVRPRDYRKQLLAVGDPDLSAFPQAPGGETRLPELPYSKVEIESICALLDRGQADMLCGKEASEGRLKAYLRGGCPRIVHLAAHGLVDRVESAASCVALCPDTLEGEDGYLHTLEILQMPFDAALVVVSACESAVGRVSRGEGVIGLSRAFIGAGSGGVVASLWAVSDRSTAELMRIFYEHMMTERRPAASALAEARLALLRSPDFSHPFHWSPFVAVGTDRMPW